MAGAAVLGGITSGLGLGTALGFSGAGLCGFSSGFTSTGFSLTGMGVSFSGSFTGLGSSFLGTSLTGSATGGTGSSAFIVSAS
ncbi:MAG: hypothetical protein BWX46_00525 [Candidatus Cloacimonetes bacterium ADurb.Bin003]|nr:MAG: hypothetical protein BWX46_00525 [Candidatus Cloacimonetes bacterium ADurb.Bin003]